MISALNSASAGLDIASRRLEQAASRIAHTPAFSQAESDELAGTASLGITGTVDVSPAALEAQESFSLTENLISVKEAEILYKASATVLAAVARTESDVLDILA